MVRYQFASDLTKYINEMQPHMKSSTIKDKERKLRLVCRIFTDLYKEGKVSTNNARKITKEDIYVYVTFRRKANISEATITKELSCLNQMLLWLDNKAVQDFRVFGGVYKPRSYTGRKDPLPNDLINKVIDLARTTESWKIMQGCMATILCACCGLRPQEARQMYIDGISFVDGRCILYIEHVKGEGTWGMPRNVLAMDDTEDIFVKYMGMRENVLSKYGKNVRAMFPPLQNDREFYTQQAFGRLKEAVEKELNVKYELRAGRRAFGQRLLDKGNRLEDVSVAMGHNSTKTTEGYYARCRDSLVMANILANERSKRPC